MSQMVIISKMGKTQVVDHGNPGRRIAMTVYGADLGIGARRYVLS